MPAITFKIPYDSNLRYLPLVYLLPEELWVRCPTLMKIPRNPRQVFRSEELLRLIDSDAFLDEIMDAVSALAFPHFGFPGWLSRMERTLHRRFSRVASLLLHAAVVKGH